MAYQHRFCSAIKIKSTIKKMIFVHKIMSLFSKENPQYFK